MNATTSGVEAVKSEIFSQTCNNFACTDTCIEDRELDALLDRLILAVKAEMPCSNPYVSELQVEGGCPNLGTYCESDKWPPRDAYRFCPSCTARKELG